MTPSVTVIIPCYNAARWLPATLASALAQTWPALDVVVIDDGSTDDSLALARQAASDRVQVFSQLHAGAAAARNHGLRVARGDYIQFLDADDLLAPDKIVRQLAALRSAPPRQLASGPWGRFEQNPAAAEFIPEDNWPLADPVAWLTLNFAGRGMMPPVAWLTPRAVLNAAGPWDERLSLNDDGEYFCRVLLASAGLVFCPEAKSYYRSNLPGSLSRLRSPAAWLSGVLSHELCARHLLAREDTPRTRRACADLFQRLVYAMYPDCPDLVRRCEEQVRRHGGSVERCGGGRAFQLLSRAFGWKLARRLQRRFAAPPPAAL